MDISNTSDARIKRTILYDMWCNVESLSFRFSSFLLKEETKMGSAESKVNTEAIQKEVRYFM